MRVEEKDMDKFSDGRQGRGAGEGARVGEKPSVELEEKQKRAQWR